MTAVEAIEAAQLGDPHKIGFGYYTPNDDGERRDDPPPIAEAIDRAGGSRVMSGRDLPTALEALKALGSIPAAPIVVHTTNGIYTLVHDGGWRHR